MDHMMPVMDGIEAVKIIRGMGYTRPVVALTANAVVGQSSIFLANGFDGFIPKPIDSRDLDAMLKRFIHVKENSAGPAQEMRNISEVGKYFILDAENALGVIEELYAKLNVSGASASFDAGASDAGVIERYITAVHGIKSALANVGEAEMSGAALRLEQLGRDKHIAAITEETPVFMDALRLLINKYRPVADSNAGDINGDNAVYLRTKLLAIETACNAFDKTAAKDALKDLRQKTWPGYVNGVFDIISVHLLHSEFEEAAKAAHSAADIDNASKKDYTLSMLRQKHGA